MTATSLMNLTWSANLPTRTSNQSLNLIGENEIKASYLALKEKKTTMRKRRTAEVSGGGA